MSVFYKVCYLIGFIPWDRTSTPTIIKAMQAGPGMFKPGRALDLGCGSGRESLYLAQHGWQVTGVDGEQRALARAQKRATAAGATVEWVHGDVTRLREANVTGPFEFLVDSRCFHSMTDRERARYCESITEVASADAQLLMVAFGRGRGRGGPRGADREDVEESLGARWEITWSGPADESDFCGLAPRNSTASYYLLRRKGS